VSALDGGETVEQNEKTRGGENEQGGYFSEAEKNHRKQREHKQRRKKTREQGCKQRTDENKRKGI